MTWGLIEFNSSFLNGRPDTKGDKQDISFETPCTDAGPTAFAVPVNAVGQSLH